MANNILGFGYEDEAYSSILKNHEIRFNGYKSSYFNLYVSEYPIISRLNEEVENIEIEGRSGSLTIKKGTYKDRSIKIKFKRLEFMKSSFNLNDNYYWSYLNKIEEWLTNIKDNRLFYDRNDRCYSVKRVIIGDFKRELNIYYEFEVEFIVEPFQTDIRPFSTSWLENEYILINSGDFKAVPTFKLEGNGDVQLTVNGETCTIKNVNESVTINSELMLCFSEKGNKLIDMNGKFPLINVGANVIKVSNNCERVGVTYTNLYR